MTKSAAIIIFPGSNCDRDSETVLAANGFNTHRVWHGDSALPEGLDLIVLPGGFSYGDYLRCGAMAAQSPIMQAVKAFANQGGYVLGICNGFQMLCESGLLPGALTRNQSLTFMCKDVPLRVENATTSFTKNYESGQCVTMPIAHFDGCYYADEATLKELEENKQILFRYCDAEGNADESANPNGSVSNIAGIMNKAGNVLGMMPHPERHAEALLGGLDGKAMFEGLLAA